MSTKIDGMIVSFVKLRAVKAICYLAAQINF